MKLVKAMDAGPIYFQETVTGLDLDKKVIYKGLAERGARWLVGNLSKIREMHPDSQEDSEATYTVKLDTTMSELDPQGATAEEMYRRVVALDGFPKAKYWFFGKKCIINEAQLAKKVKLDDLKEIEQDVWVAKKRLFLAGKDGDLLEILRLQPEGKRPMEAAAFLNGYGKSAG